MKMWNLLEETIAEIEKLDREKYRFNMGVWVNDCQICIAGAYMVGNGLTDFYKLNDDDRRLCITLDFLRSGFVSLAFGEFYGQRCNLRLSRFRGVTDEMMNDPAGSGVAVLKETLAQLKELDI